MINDIYLTGEENDNGQAFALDPHNNILYTVPVLGRCDFENLALLELENPNLIAIVIGADTAGAPLFLYVGENDSEINNFSFTDKEYIIFNKLSGSVILSINLFKGSPLCKNSILIFLFTNIYYYVDC